MKGLFNIFDFIPQNNRFERIVKIAKIDFRKRYYNNVLGLAWAFINPLVRITIYYIVFTWIFKSEIPDFGFYIFIGFIIWLSFTEISSKSFNLFQSKKYLIQNIQFNKVDLFYSSLITVLLGFIFNFLTVLIALWITGHGMHSGYFWLPVVLLIYLMILLGVSIILAIVKLFLKDIDMIWSIILLTGFWATPIFHDHISLFMLAPWMKWANPFAGIIVNVREIVLYGNQPDLLLIFYNFCAGLFCVVLGSMALGKYGKYAYERT